VLSPRRYGRFRCSGCGLYFRRRRAADPAEEPLRCVCCWALANLPNADLRETLRRAIDRHDIRRRVFGGRDA
jgi:hypothetical protein